MDDLFAINIINDRINDKTEQLTNFNKYKIQEILNMYDESESTSFGMAWRVHLIGFIYSSPSNYLCKIQEISNMYYERESTSFGMACRARLMGLIYSSFSSNKLAEKFKKKKEESYLICVW